jgi:hypothetical protein
VQRFHRRLQDAVDAFEAERQREVEEKAVARGFPVTQEEQRHHDRRRGDRPHQHFMHDQSPSHMSP